MYPKSLERLDILVETERYVEHLERLGTKKFISRWPRPVLASLELREPLGYCCLKIWRFANFNRREGSGQYTFSDCKQNGKRETGVGSDKGSQRLRSFHTPLRQGDENGIGYYPVLQKDDDWDSTHYLDEAATGGNEFDPDLLGKEDVAAWKAIGGKSKEWRKTRFVRLNKDNLAALDTRWRRSPNGAPFHAPPRHLPIPSKLCVASVCRENSVVSRSTLGDIDKGTLRGQRPAKRQKWQHYGAAERNVPKLR